MPSVEQRFFDVVSRRQVVRPSVRAIIFSEDHRRILLQRPIGDVGTHYAFIGGEYQVGDTLAGRLQVEIEEESNARLTFWEYLFVVENRFLAGDNRVHALEHYLLATIDREEVESLEPQRVLEWLSVDQLSSIDLRPTLVRDLIISGDLRSARHLITDGWLDGGSSSAG